MAINRPIHTSRPLSRTVPYALLAAATLALAGCGDGSGGAAGDIGDGNVDPFAPSPIEPFVGLYDLTGNWDGTPGDIATLVIRPVGEDGTARALIYDEDDGRGCNFRPSPAGEVVVDPAFEEMVFMNRVPPFDEATLTLSGTDLVITYFGADDERLTYTAPAIGITEEDVQPQC